MPNDHFLDIDGALRYMWSGNDHHTGLFDPEIRTMVPPPKNTRRSDHTQDLPGSRMASILIVDDEAPIRTLLRRILEDDGHMVREAENGQIGLTLYREDPADLVITDILMPERDGMEVTLALTQEFLDAKVIAMTGGTGDQNFLNVAKLFGARRVIQKPFTVEEMRRLVRYTLEH